MMNIIKGSIWIVAFILGINLSFEMISQANTMENIVAAKAEKEANQLREQALTPAILEKMWIEKWDGKLPVYGQVPTIFKDISK